MFPFARYVHLFPPSLQWVPWPLLSKPCGSPPSSVLRGHKTAPPSVDSAYGLPWRPRYRSCERRWRALLGSWGIPLEACPELGTPATPARPRIIGRPDAAFRLVNSVGIAISRFSELNLRGLLPCCVRFAPTSRPVNGNTRYRPACSLWPLRDLHPLDSIKGFHRLIFGSSSSTLFPAR
jgi:hypothetical protein